MSVLGKRKRKQTSNSDISEPANKKQKEDNDMFAEWEIFLNDNKWTISVFKGTPLDDIKQNISEITGIHSFECMDHKGHTLILSSHLPNNTKIYIVSKGKKLCKQNNSDKNDTNTNNLEIVKYDKNANRDKNDINTNNNTTDTTKVRKLVLKVLQAGDDDPLRLKCSLNTLWCKIFLAFANYKGTEVRSLRFCYDGMGLNAYPDRSVSEFVDYYNYDEDEEIQINVMYEQKGS